jgi:protein-tyrosine phosphatase
VNSSSALAVPFDGSYWVLPDQFLAGENPAAASEAATIRRVQALLRSGITVYYDLTEHPDHRSLYDSILYQQASEYQMGIRYYNFPIPDFTAPPEKLVKIILDSIDLNLQSGSKVFVHCHAGIGRTGTLVGCWLAWHGTTGQAALGRLSRLRSQTPSWFRSAPETPGQVDRVLNWKKGE